MDTPGGLYCELLAHKDLTPLANAEAVRPFAAKISTTRESVKMRARKVRWVLSFVSMAVVGATYQFGCTSFLSDQLLRTSDFCFLFDCQNGAFAGLFDPCPQNVLISDDANGIEGNTNLFVDCPINNGG